MPFHRLAPVVDLGERVVVASALERDVRQGVLAAVAERAAVVELESVARGAASTLLVDETAPTLVPLVDGPPDRGRDVARAG